MTHLTTSMKWLQKYNFEALCSHCCFWCKNNPLPPSNTIQIQEFSSVFKLPPPPPPPGSSFGVASANHVSTALMGIIGTCFRRDLHKRSGYSAVFPLKLLTETLYSTLRLYPALWSLLNPTHVTQNCQGLGVRFYIMAHNYYVGTDIERTATP